MTKNHSFYSKLLSLCLIFLGFGAYSGCGRHEYGSPYAKYKISGKVVANDAQGQPIKNIKVSLTQYYELQYPLPPVLPPVTTDANGRFSIQGQAYSRPTALLFEDIDGPENGSFTNLIQDITFQPSDFMGGGKGWYEGEASRDLGTIKLNPEQE